MKNVPFYKQSISIIRRHRYTICALLVIAIIMSGCLGCNNLIEESSCFWVSFETDGGMPVPAMQEVMSGETVTAPSPNPVKTGYAFMFWHLSEDATAYNFQSPVNSDITLFAKWEDETNVEYWQITWNLNGGSWPGNANHASQVVKGGTLAEPNQPTKAGSEFDGWYKEAALTNKVTFPYNVNGVTANISLYAKWTTASTDAQLSVTDNRLTFVSTAGGTGFGVITNQPSWNATSNKTWCTLPIASGVSGDKCPVNIEANTATVSREAAITVTAGNAIPQVVSVFQAGAGAQLSVSPGSVELKKEGETKTVTVTTNQSSWDAVSNQEWLTVSKAGNTITLTAPAFTGESNRNATVTVSAVHALPQRIYVTQKAPEPNIAFVGRNPVIESLYTWSGFFTGSQLNFNLVVYDAAGRTSITITEEATGAPNGNRKTITQTRDIPISGPGTYQLSQSIMSSESYAQTYSQFTFTVSAHGMSYSRNYSGLYNSLNGAWGHYFVTH